MKIADVEGDAMLLAGAVALIAVWYVYKKGAGTVAQSTANGIASAATGVVTGAAVGTVTGVADGVSQAIGIPTTEQTIQDPAQARWVIDNYGYWTASSWCGAVAFAKAALMDSGSGTPPPANSPFMLAHSGSSDVAVNSSTPIDTSGSLW